MSKSQGSRLKLVERLSRIKVSLLCTVVCLVRSLAMHFNF